MRDTQSTLQDMAAVIGIDGLHRGEQLGRRGHIDRLDICALAFTVAEWRGPLTIPVEFFTDELAGMRLIESSAGAMTAIRALSDALDSHVDEEELAPGLFVPNHIAHVSNWARCGEPTAQRPPTNAEVCAHILRAANTLAIQNPASRPGHTDAWGLCRTCGGHGSLTTGDEAIPYDQLSPRRKQGHDLGHRFTRPTSRPCPHCDGRDRATDAAVTAHEATL